jgi:hypothetical protein
MFSLIILDRSVKLLLALISTVILGFESCWDPWPYFSFQDLCVLWNVAPSSTRWGVWLLPTLVFDVCTIYIYIYIYIARTLYTELLYRTRLEFKFLDMSDKFSTTYQPPCLLQARAAGLGATGWRVKGEGWRWGINISPLVWSVVLWNAFKPKLTFCCKTTPENQPSVLNVYEGEGWGCVEYLFTPLHTLF